MALEPGPVEAHSRRQSDLDRIRLVSAVGGDLADPGDLIGPPDHAFPGEESQRQLAVVSGGAQRHRERPAVHADLERPFDRDPVLRALDRARPEPGDAAGHDLGIGNGGLLCDGRRMPIRP